MDAEAGRCRRTDGKKWRCRLAVIPDHKYCERHVHRGRLRSRKPVEVHTTILKSKSKSKSTTTDPISPIKATPNLQSVTNGNDGNQNKGQINNQSFKIKKNSKENARTSLEFSFSLKSILQHNNVQHCGTSNNNHIGALAITESNRCRRTDGKKWRCSKNALPKEKYCGQHMHRGTKKVLNYEKPNTGLSLSIGSNCQQMSDDGNRSSEATTSSDSDATTISM